METDKHVAIVRSRLDRLVREIRSTPDRHQAEIVPALESLLLELDGRESASAERTGRAITLTELRDRLTGMPGGRHVLEAIDMALADGSD